MQILFVLLGFLLGLHMVAQSASASEQSANRVALVIGNSAYQHAGELANPKNDAIDVAAAFEKVGFKVITGIDLDKSGMDRTIRKFARALSRAKVGAFFYAGHGIQVDGKNYLVPVDAQLEDATGIDFELLRMDVIQRAMERGSKTNLIFLDACRNNPLARNLARAMGTRSASIGRGLATIESGVGTMISFSTQPGNVALDGTGRNSPFAAALSKHLGTPGDDISDILISVRRDVMRATNNKQIPWEHTALTDKLVFVPKAAGPSPEKLAEHAFWDIVKDSQSPAVLQTYLTRYPKGTYSQLASALIQQRKSEIKARSDADARARKLRDAELARQRAERRRQEAKRKAVEARRTKELREMRKALQELKNARRQKRLADKKLGIETDRAQSEEAASARQRQEDARRAEEARQAAEFRRAIEEMRQTRKALKDLAAERAEAEKAVASARKAAEEAKAEAEARAKTKQVVAGLRPPSASSISSPVPESPKQMATKLQRELKRVGCYHSVIDGDWGPGSKKAMNAFNAHAKTAFYVDKPSIAAIDAISKTYSRICPARQPAHNGTITKARSGRTVNSNSSGGRNCISYSQCLRGCKRKGRVSNCHRRCTSGRPVPAGPLC